MYEIILPNKIMSVGEVGYFISSLFRRIVNSPYNMLPFEITRYIYKGKTGPFVFERSYFSSVTFSLCSSSTFEHIK